MLRDPSVKYRPFPQVDLVDRRWPTRTIERAPRWLSTDLRDGNQALIDPMDAEKKGRFFDLLVKLGLKEIEIGFPSAGSTEFNFVRSLVHSDRIPDDVTVQVLTQARRELIKRTFDSLDGAPRAVVHLYSAISPAWRRIVFGLDRADVREIAVSGAKMLRDEASKRPGTDWRFEYSPETFSTAELDYSLEVCEAVMQVLRPSREKPLILNLPATVEAATPNVYADQIEWFCRNLPNRDRVVISLHPHNDRGTAVAAAELGLLAGADRIEGCLFGNGERTGNVDLVTLALNMYSQGVHPKLDFSDIDEVIRTVEYCNAIPVHPRHPYAGDLVFTAFSGSHQDAIKKGFAAKAADDGGFWEVPYLPIDPADLGRSYEAMIRVNSQSGKAGVAWVIEQDKGLRLPKRMQADFSQVVQLAADETGRELDAEEIWSAFVRHYHVEDNHPLELIDYEKAGAVSDRRFVGRIRMNDEEQLVIGHGNGHISGVIEALGTAYGVELEVVDYSEHAIGGGAGAKAAAYIECRSSDGRPLFGVGIDSDVATASVRAVMSAANTFLSMKCSRADAAPTPVGDVSSSGEPAQRARG